MKRSHIHRRKSQTILWSLVGLVVLWIGVIISWPIAPVLPAAAQPAEKIIKVATRVIPPFVIQEDNRLTGFSIDLWRSIADEINVKSEFLVQPDVNQLLNTVKIGQAEIGISAVSITSDRYKSFDFSQPILESGLQILVRDESTNHASWLNAFTVLISPALLQLVGLMLVLIVILAHIIWWFERRHPRGMIANTAYFPGILQACWWAAATLATQADEMPKGAITRLVAVFWMFVSVVFVAYFTATVTTSLTIQQLRGTINGPEDLPGQRVATTAGSTSALYLQQHNAQVLEFPKIEDAYDALLSNKAEAVVFDAPVLLYYASRQGRGKVHTVGAIFRQENYGIVLPPNSPYEKAINKALLTLRENGTYQDLYSKWFTNPSGNN